MRGRSAQQLTGRSNPQTITYAFLSLTNRHARRHAQSSLCNSMGAFIETLQCIQYRRLWFVPSCRIFLSRSKATDSLSGSSGAARSEFRPSVFVIEPHSISRPISNMAQAMRSRQAMALLISLGFKCARPAVRTEHGAFWVPTAARLADIYP